MLVGSMLHTFHYSADAFQSLEEFVSEAGEVMQKALSVYVDAVS
jgi:hypothetical protein